MTSCLTSEVRACLTWRACVVWMLQLIASCGLAWADALPPLAIGVYLPATRDVPRKDVEITMRFWVEELARSAKLPFKPVRFYDTMAELKRDVVDGEINFMFATTMGIAQYFARDELVDGFFGKNASYEELLLVVRRDAAIRGLADLAGKRLALVDGDELSQVYLQHLMLKTWGKLDEGRLASVSRDRRAVSTVHRLFFNQADAALVDRHALDVALALNPQIGKLVQVLDEHTFKGGASATGLFSARVAPQHADYFTQVALALGTTVRGRQLLDIYHADTLTATRVSDLEPFRALLAERRALLAKATPSKLPVKAK